MKAYLVCICLLLTGLNASVSKGKELFAKKCRSCHIEGKYFASSKKANEWAKILKTDSIKQGHLDLNLSLPYLNSQEFQDDKKHFKALFQKYSKDRGKHNSCY